jgi:hypothetical protein
VDDRLVGQVHFRKLDPAVDEDGVAKDSSAE